MRCLSGKNRLNIGDGRMHLLRNRVRHFNSNLQQNFRDYPAISDPYFYERLFRKKEFYENACAQIRLWKNTSAYISQDKTVMKPLPHQKIVSQYLSPFTPYSGLLFFWGVGVGKTFGATLVIEENKQFLMDNHSKSLILTPNKIIQDVFIAEILGEHKTLGGNTVYIKGCTQNAYVDDEMREKLNNCTDPKERKKIKNYILDYRVKQFYEFNTHETWYNSILKGEMSDEEIHQKYSNRIIVVDEIHQTKNIKSNLYKALEKIVRIADNLKLMLLSATPMIDDPTDICQPINLLRINDGFRDDELLTPEIVQDYIDGSKEAKDKMLEYTKGYISYMRGLNPHTFPKRVDVGNSILNNLDFKLVQTWMKNGQAAKYIKVFMEEFIGNTEAGFANELWNRTREISRCFIPQFDYSSSLHLSSQRWWMSEQTENYACKFEEMWTNFQTAKGKGPILVYAFNVEKGITVFEEFLKGRGVSEYKKGGNNHETFFNFGKTTDQRLIDHVIKILKGHNNHKGQTIKYILGSGKVRYGLTFSHVSQIHIIEPDWNIASTEQIIGRGIRHFSHIHPLLKNINQTVQVFRYRASIPNNILDCLDDFTKKKFQLFIIEYRDILDKRGFLGPNGELLSIDEYMYTIAIKKDYRIKQIERLLKENSVDAAFNIFSNYFPVETDISHTRLCEYQSAEYTVPIPSAKRSTKIANMMPLTKNDIDDSTYDLCLSSKLNHKCSTLKVCPSKDIVDAIVQMFENQRILTLENISNGCVDYQQDQVYITIDLLVQKKTVLKVQNEPGYIVYRGHYYIFVPNKSQLLLEDIPIYFHDVLLENNHKKQLSDYLEHIPQIDSLFLVPKDIPKIFIPESFAKDLFEVTDNAIILLKKDQEVGVVYNTKDHPNTYNLKICHHKSQKIACNNKFLKDLHAFAEKLGSPLQANKKKILEEHITKLLIKKRYFLPWITKEKPNFFRIKIIAKAWKCLYILKKIKLFESNLAKELSTFSKMLVEIFKYRVTNPDLQLEIDKQLAINISEIPDYLLRLLGRMHGDRPRDFKENIWNLIQNTCGKITNKQKDLVNDIYSDIIKETKIRLKTDI